MKKIQDNFSKQVSYYKKFRPEYPSQLYDFILSNVDGRRSCWDCGTGNGQVAKVLANHFDKVYATDISEKQIGVADDHPKIDYSVARAEKTPFSDSQFDLITVGQAVHWFDFEAFNTEVKRVGKPGSTIAIWGYGLLSIDEEVDKIVQKFYTETIGPYWNDERRHIDNKYDSIHFDFEEIKTPDDIFIYDNWKREQLVGYLNSWSSVQHYKNAHNGKNPVEPVAIELAKIWNDDEVKGIKMPLFLRMGRV